MELLTTIISFLIGYLFGYLIIKFCESKRHRLILSLNLKPAQRVAGMTIEQIKIYNYPLLSKEINKQNYGRNKKLV